MSNEQVVEDPLLGELLDLVGLDKPVVPQEAEGTVENLIKSAEAKEVPVEEELPEVKEPVVETEQVVSDTPEAEVVPPTELEEAQATIVKLTEALNKPLESTPIPEITPTLVAPLEQPVPVLPVVQPDIPPVVAVSKEPPVQQTVVPTVSELSQDVFEQLMTSPKAFQAHLNTVAAQAAQSAREQTLLELGPMIDMKMNARTSVETQVKEFFAEPNQQDIVSRNHSPLVVMQAELVQQKNPTSPLAQVLQHSTNMVRQQVGLPVINYTIPQVQEVQKVRTPSAEQRFAAPTTRRQAAQPKEDPNIIVSTVMDMAQGQNGIGSLLT